MNSKRLLKIILSVFVFVLLLTAVPCAVSSAADDELPALKSVQVEDVSFEEGMSCEYTYDIIYDDTEDGEAEEVYWLYYTPVFGDVILTFDDGSTEAYSYEDFYLSGYDYYVKTSQSVYNQWSVGEHVAELVVGDISAEYKVTLVESTIEKIEADAVEITEFTNGYTVTEEDEEGDMAEWYCYESFTPDLFTVSFKSGETQRFTSDELQSLLYASDYDFETDQTLENQWSTGDHTASMYIGGFSLDFTVTIRECAVESITVDDVTLTEGADGEYVEVYDENDNPTDDYWYRYDYYPRSITVHYNNGTTESLDSLNELRNIEGFENTEEIIMCDEQSFENSWKAGSYKIRLLFGIYSAEYNVVIEKSDIAFVSVDDIAVTEGTNGYFENSEDKGTYFKYILEPDIVRIHYTDGTSDEFDLCDAEENGIRYKIVSDQSADNIWKTGKHTVTLYYGVSYKCEYTFEILPSDVVDISVQSVELTDKISGYTEIYYDSETDEEAEWFCFTPEPQIINVRFKDGTEGEYTPEEFYELTGFEYYVTTDQSYENQWTAGTHKATFTVNNLSCEFDVEIKEFPYTDFIFHDFKVTEGKGGYFSETEEEDGDTSYYFNYYIEPLKFTAVKNGDASTGVTYDYSEFYAIAGFEPQWISDQSAENPWNTGEHTASFIWDGREFFCNVIIEDNGINASYISCTPLITGVDGYYEIINSDGNNSHRFIYEVQIENLTFSTDGGMSYIEGDDFISDTGLECMVHIPGQNKEQLKNIAQLHIGNDVYEFEYTTTTSDVEKISAEKIVVYEGTSGSYEGHIDEDGNYSEWFKYDVHPSKVTISYRDSETITYDCDSYGVNNLKYIAYDNQSFENQWSPGKNTAYLVVGGVFCEYTVEVIRLSEDFLKPELIELNRDYTKLMYPLDRVYYKFVPEKTGIYEFSTYTDSIGAQSWFYDESFNVLSYNSSCDGEVFLYITCQLEKGKTYYFAASFCDESVIADLTVRLNEYVCRHLFEGFISNADATCMADGTKTAKCKYCEETKTVVDEGSALGHALSQWSTLEEATCSKAGVEIRSCIRCDFTATRDIPVTEHTIEKIPAVSATCTKKGYTEGLRCALCRIILVPQKEILPRGHAIVYVSGKNATCTESGLTVGRACSVCGVVIEESREIPAHGHFWIQEDGRKICGVCLEIVDSSDSSVTKPPTEETTKPDVEDPTKTPTEETTKPNIEDTTKPSAEPTTKPDAEDPTKPPIEETTKPDVEEITKPSTEPTTKPNEEHKHTEVVVKGKAASCTEKGLTDGKKCSECGQVTVAQKEIPATGHKEVILEAVFATYTNTGLTEGKKCSACGEILVAQKSVSRKKLKKVSSLKVKKSTSSSVTLSWKKVEGADSYKVYYSTDGKKWKSVKVKKNTATIKKLKSGTQYRFKVRAFAGKYYGTASKIVKKTTKVKKPVISKITSSKKNTAVVSWKKVTNASGYVVEYSTSKKFTKKTTKIVKIKKGKTTKATLKKLKSGKKYYVRVKAYKTVSKKASYGSYSAVKTVKVK